jgi:hypothetical protein
MKKKLPIIDTMFSHCFTTSDKPSELMEWDRENIDHYDYVFITDNSLNNININKKKYCWLVESPEITPHSYNFVKNNSTMFDQIFTFKRDFLENFDNTNFLPIGGCWINETEQNLYFDVKSKLISMVSSSKKITSGHKLRHHIINNMTDNVDLYGREYNPINNKITSLKEYMFQIVVENTKEDYYFTEKIIDCFRTGVIPIYWGCPSIDKFFDINGIIQFNTTDELEKIINDIGKDLYEIKKESIENNFNLSKKYLYAEHYLIKNYENYLI